MQLAYILRNFDFLPYKGAGTFHSSRTAIDFRLYTPFKFKRVLFRVKKIQVALSPVLELDNFDSKTLGDSLISVLKR